MHRVWSIALETRSRPVAAAFAGLLALLAVDAVTLAVLPSDSAAYWWFVSVYLGVEAAAALLIALRVVRVRRERLAWALLSLAFVWLMAADAVESISAGPGGTQPNSLVSQILYGGFAVCMFVGLGLLVRARVARVSASVWLDGTIAALGLFAVSTSFTLTHGETLSGPEIIELLYPAIPLLFVALLIGALTALDRRPSPAWYLLVAAALVMTVSNVVTNPEMASGTYAFGNPYDVMWPLAAVLVAAAAWVSPTPPPPGDSRVGGLVFFPAGFSVAALVVLLVDDGAARGASSLFAAGTLAASTLRLLLTVADAERLRHRQVQLNRSLAQARDEAVAAASARSVFVATMSHEIRTPLNAVLGMNELLLGTRLDAVQREYAERAASSGSLLLDLITDILDFSKIEAGALEIERRAFDLRRLVAGSATVLLHAAESKGLPIDVRIDDDCPPWVLGDATRLRQVLVNLLGNAVKFTDAGGVVLRVRQAGPGVTAFEITDTGTGIAEDQLDRLFEPFAQADESITRTHGGTGLGLTICRSLVELMGGRITVESTLGSGSRFRFELPLAPATAPEHTSADRAARSDAGAPATTALRVLVVEDNAALRLLSTRLVAALGHDVESVVDGAEAVAAAARTSYDVVLMDVHMPVLDGLEATRRIRAAAGPQPRIVGLTAGTSARDRDDCAEAGMDDFVAKPFTSEDLRRAFAALDGLEPAGEAAARAFSRLDELGEDARAEVLQAFVEQSTHDRARLVRALAGGDATTLRFIAHRLRGASLALGADELAEACRPIETAAPDAVLDPALHRRLLEALDSALERIAEEDRARP
ncbi:ATP-binding protein [Rathayibacter sp. VKM Ac-2759]|uniref:ATP-binding protein n=1 Tax=Rathayibacter sp. VKM Ac-2759 TaxID=2609252 RepID=UPI001FC949BD|nr:ATP-binding protein [Rathayibacter sp. VKM Ac-2759]